MANMTNWFKYRIPQKIGFIQELEHTTQIVWYRKAEPKYLAKGRGYLIAMPDTRQVIRHSDISTETVERYFHAHPDTGTYVVPHRSHTVGAVAIIMHRSKNLITMSCCQWALTMEGACAQAKLLSADVVYSLDEGEYIPIDAELWQPDKELLERATNWLDEARWVCAEYKRCQNKYDIQSKILSGMSNHNGVRPRANAQMYGYC